MGSAASRSKVHVRQTETGRVISIPHQHPNDHINILVKGLSELRYREMLCDIVIVTHGNDEMPTSKHRAHKCVLAATSGYFREKFGISSEEFESNSSECKTSDSKVTFIAEKKTDRGEGDVIHLDFSVSSSAMESVLKYVYTAVLDTKLQKVEEVMEAAIKLEIPTLTQRCIAEIENGFLLEYFQRIFRLACHLNLYDLKNFALRSVIESFDLFVDTKCFLRLNESELQEIANNRRGMLSSKSVITELQLFNALLKWSQHEQKQRKDSAVKLLKQIQFEKIPQSTLCGYVITHDVVNRNKELCGDIENILGSDRKRILQRLKDRTEEKQSCVTDRGGVGDAPALTRHTLLVTGGRLFDQFTAQVIEFNEKDSSWKELTRLPTTLSNHSITVMSNTLYVAGGEETALAGTRAISSLWSYDPAKNEWETLPEMQHGRAHFYLGGISGALLAVAGRSSNVCRSSVEKFCPNMKRWEFCQCLKAARYNHAGSSHKQQIYISGGTVKKSSSSDLMKFDLDENQWRGLNPMKCPRSRHCMASAKDRLYVFGGETELQGVSQPVSIALECYTPQCDQWHKVAQKLDFQSDRECACAELRGQIYLIGGCRSNMTDYRNDVACYDPDSDTWLTLQKLPRRIRGSACAVILLR